MTNAPTPETTSTASWLPLAAVALTLFLWASAFVAIRHLGPDFSPGSLALGRMLVASAALAPLALRRGLPRPTGRQWASIGVIGVLWYGVYMVALNEGEHRVDAGTAAMLVQISPILIAVLAALFLQERFTVPLVLGLALAFTGVVVIALGGSADGSRDVVGVLLCIVAAVAYSISLVVQKPLSAHLPAIRITWLACTVGALACLPFTGALIRDVQQAPAASVWWVVYLGLFPTAVAFTAYGYALAHMSASSLGVSTYLVPVITIGLSFVLLGEVPTALAVVGGVLALLGVAVARRPQRNTNMLATEVTKVSE